MNSITESKPQTMPSGNESGRVKISRRHIAKSVLSNWSGLTVNVLVAFWMIPFVVHHLGDAAYGIWALVLQLTGYLGIVDTGLRSAIVRFVARFHAQKDDGGLNQLLNSIITVYAMFAPLCLVAGVLLAWFALPHMHIPADLLHKSQITILITSAILACDFIFAIFHAGLAGLSRWDLTNGVGICTVLLRTALIVIVLELGYGLVALAVVQFCTTVSSYLAETLILRKLIPSYRFHWQKPDWISFKPILEHSWYSLLLSLANRVNYQVDTIVIAAFRPIEEVTFYVIGLRLVEYLRDLLNSTTMIIAPLASAVDAVGEFKEVGNMLIRSTKYSLIVGFLGVAVLLSIGPDFIRIWMGPRFVGSSGTVLVILAIGLLLSFTQYASGHILFGLSKHRMNLNWTIVESVLNLGFSIGLVHRYGIFGVAAGTTIANAIVRGWFFPRAFLKFLNVHWRDFIFHAVVPAAVPAIGFLMAVLACKRVLPIEGYAELFLVVLAGSCVCLPFLWICGLDRSDRKILWAKGRQLILRTESAGLE